MSANRRVGTIGEIPEDGSLLVTCEDEAGTELEVILLRNGETVLGWENHCQHWTDVRLDGGDGVTRRNGELVCSKHGAMFEVDSGVCTHGPCKDAVLDAVALVVRDGEVFLAEPGWTVAHLGPCEERERSSRGGVGFP